MDSDVLAETLEALRLRGTAYFKAEFRAPWGMALPAGDVAAFHVVVQGGCWLRVPGQPPRELRGGDVLLFPQGAAHELAHAADAEAHPAEELLGRPGERPPDSGYGGTGSVTTLVCGHFSYDRRGLHPFFTALPEMIHVSGEDAQHASWVATASQMAAAEATGGQRGASVVVDRLAEALLIQTLRQFLAGSAEPRGFLAAAEDPGIGRALSCIHGHPARRWTVGDLAGEAGMSRSVLAQRFRELVGESPMRYLARWRMLAARRLLTAGALGTAEVAERVGYDSEFAFAKAFKRFFGEGPGAVRRSVAGDSAAAGEG
jgi:AraC-like DNA-binding protein